MDLDKREFGIRLRELRQHAKLSQAALAKAASVGQARLSDWENGLHNPTALAAHRLAEALGVTVAQLFEPPSPAPARPAAGDGKGKAKLRPGQKRRRGKSGK
jgi:transcriptional regulator with XRE-family HTH domain